MHVLNVRDVNEALPRALAYLRDTGRPEDTRNGPALVALGPVATVYADPMRRVLFDPERDANPFFHLFESLWILAGRRDVRFLSWFNSRIADYSDDGTIFHAPYGYRLRRAFNGVDQIEEVANLFRKEPLSRRAVLQIWDSRLDLNASTKDTPCNDLVMLRVRDDPYSQHASTRSLDITVCNRSNDALWGAYGANAVQFSFLHEYLAYKINVGVGKYTQMSNNLHVYTDNPYWLHWYKDHLSGVHVPPCAYDWQEDDGALPQPLPMMRDGEGTEAFDGDLRVLFDVADASLHVKLFCDRLADRMFKTCFFRRVVKPMAEAFDTRDVANLDPDIDWHYAAAEWISRRKRKAS